jgi:uracil phosphoribosyltransferase
MIHILSKENSIFNKFIAQIRDHEVQRDSMRFRRNMERIGEVMSYEISRTLDYRTCVVETPLGEAEVQVISDKLVVATILRAGLPFHQGFLNYFDDAQNAFVAAYRKYDKGEDFHINIEYCSTPDLTGKTLILADTMLATGASLEIAYNRLCQEGEPKHTHLVCPICSAYAVEYIKKHLPGDRVTLWVAAIDEELTSHSYIVPGLGDAGDLAYGTKK